MSDHLLPVERTITMRRDDDNEIRIIISGLARCEIYVLSRHDHPMRGEILARLLEYVAERERRHAPIYIGGHVIGWSVGAWSIAQVDQLSTWISDRWGVDVGGFVSYESDRVLRAVDARPAASP